VRLRPFFSYFGAKWRSAPHYPEPTHDTIVEPFAGSAGCAIRYPERRVILVDKSPAIAGIWSYLIKASEAEVLALPDLAPGERVCDVPGLLQEQRWLMGMWVQLATASPRQTMTKWQHGDGRPVDQAYCWGRRVRARIASQLHAIRHWVAVCSDYTTAPNLRATWYIDPPYTGTGRRYPHHELDYAALGEWCRARRGQVIVCESADADWLPFERLGRFHSRMGGFVEGIWTP
jgi:hypothetical protein